MGQPPTTDGPPGEHRHAVVTTRVVVVEGFGHRRQVAPTDNAVDLQLGEELLRFAGASTTTGSSRLAAARGPLMSGAVTFDPISHERAV